MSIPQIISNTQVSTPSGGVPLDSTSFRNAALAPGKIGAAIGQDVGGVFTDIATKLQANRNARTVFEADIAMRTAKTAFTESLAKNRDEGTWVPNWKEQSQNVRDRILTGKNVGPDVQRVLTQNLDAWQVATTAEVATAARLKGIKETHDTALVASTMAFQQGDMEGGNNILKAAVAHYGMDQAEANIHMMKGKEVAVESAAATAVNSDPITAPEVLEKSLKSQIEPKKYRAIYRNALEMQSRQQSLNAHDLYTQLALTHTLDEEDLSQRVKDKMITQPQANALKVAFKRYGTEQTREQFGQERDDFNRCMMEVDDHDWVNDRQPEQTAQKMSENSFSWTQPALQRQLGEHIKAAQNAAKRSGTSHLTPVQKQIFEQMNENRNKNGVTVPVTNEIVSGETSYGFGGAGVTFTRSPDTVEHHMIPGGLNTLRDERKMTDAEIEKSYGKGVTRQQLLQAEQAHSANIQGKMRDWFKQNPNATYDEANTYRIELEKPFIMSAVANTIKPKAGIHFVTGQRAKQLGVVYEFDGANWKPEFKNTADVKAAFHAGSISREEAIKVLRTQFGLK